FWSPPVTHPVVRPDGRRPPPRPVPGRPCPPCSGVRRPTLRELRSVHHTVSDAPPSAPAHAAPISAARPGPLRGPAASATAVVAVPTPHRRRPPPGERTRLRGRPEASLACSGGPVRPWRSAGGWRRLPAAAQERRTPGRPGSGGLAHPAAW